MAPSLAIHYALRKGLHFLRLLPRILLAAEFPLPLFTSQLLEETACSYDVTPPPGGSAGSTGREGGREGGRPLRRLLDEHSLSLCPDPPELAK